MVTSMRPWIVAQHLEDDIDGVLKMDFLVAPGYQIANQVKGVLEILFLVGSRHHVASACQHGLDDL